MTTNDTYMYIYNPLTHIDELPCKVSTEKLGIWINRGEGNRRGFCQMFYTSKIPNYPKVARDNFGKLGTVNPFVIYFDQILSF